MTQTPLQPVPASQLAKEHKNRVFARLAIYRKLAAGAGFGAALEAPIDQGEGEIETAFAFFADCEAPTKDDLDGFYDLGFAVLETVSRAYSDLLKSEGKTELRAPENLLTETLSRRDFFIHTAQEIDVLARSACDGHTGKIWRNETQRNARIYEPNGASHRVEITLRETDAAQSLAGLETLTNAQDADFFLTLLYVASVLAPPSPLPPTHYAGGWIDLTDVMEKIGWYPSKLPKEKAAELRARLWQYLVYGDRATVKGKRTREYTDKVTKEAIRTQIESPIWRIMAVERPENQTDFADAPARVEIVIGKEWEPLLTSANLAQYLPLGEALGSIPPHKVAGDWARSVGLVLANLWRRNPREAMAGTAKITRRELLTRYTPKTRSVEELLEGNDPRRAVEYWRDALGILVECGFVERKGEAALSVEEMLKPFGRQGWQKDWLNAFVSIIPGPKMCPPVSERADALPTLKPKALPNAKRGRPRKKPPA